MTKFHIACGGKVSHFEDYADAYTMWVSLRKMGKNPHFVNV